MKRLYKSFMMASAAAAVVLSAASCDKEWLQPKPLSFFTPENTYIDAAGFSSALIAAERNMTHEFVDEYAPIMTEMYFSDVAVYGKTDASKGLYNYDTSCLPTTMASGETNRLEWYWQESFYGVKYANIVISRIDDAKYNSQEERNAVLAAALFQRAYRYYKMVHQFGDIPFLAEEIASPKADFQSHDRWDILAQLEKDMEFAYKWCAENVDRGRTSKAACGVLLMKIYMCRAEWDKAIAIGKEIVAKYPMMTARFGKDKNDPQKNLQFDIHSVEAKLDMSNTEGLMYVVSYPGMENCKRSQTMRNATPYWAKGAAIKTPDGKTGTQNSLPVGDKDKDTYLDNDLYVGRGIGSMRPSSYYQYDIWGPKEKNDQRGPLYGEGTGYNTTKSWRFMEDLYYNNTGLRGKSEYWGKPLEYPTGLSAADSIRCWFK
ncbi:MAG: RagB/SusD family nutrient uptake outer membrane protein, partial [Bacteroidales bacterium]|nr:RagB/SusD family nutrient uptake outer membrane protein [Bacteroidales bacterium]